MKLTQRRFIQSSILATLSASTPSLQAMGNSLQARIAEIIRDYAGQGDHRTVTHTDNISADWLKKRITALGVKPGETSFTFRRVQPITQSDCHYPD